MKRLGEAAIGIYLRALFAGGIAVPIDEMLMQRKFILKASELLDIVLAAHAEGGEMIAELEQEARLMRERNTRLQRELDTALRTISEE